MLKSIINKIAYLFFSPENYARFIGVRIGKGCFISTKGFSSEPFLIEIGDNVRIAKEVLLLTHGGIWPIRKIYPDFKEIDYYGKIKIGNNVYIGQRAIIMPGVTIGNNCIVGAASIVSKSIPDNSVVAGNPIKYLSTFDNYVDSMIKKGVRIHSKTPKEKIALIKQLDESQFIRKEYIKS